MASNVGSASTDAPAGLSTQSSASESAHAIAEAAARRSYGKLVAFLAARTRDVAGAQDAFSEAFAAALEDWPAHGPPHPPLAWLLAGAGDNPIYTAPLGHKSQPSARILLP